MSDSWRVWLLAARPKTLPAAVVPVWAGCLMARQLEHSIHFGLAVVTLVGAILIQIATNFFNDVIDAEKGADTKDRVGPQRAAVSGLLSSRQLYQAAILMLVGAVACGIYLMQARGWPILMIGIPSLYLSYGYTGGPFPLAYRGLGEVFVILFFGFIAVIGTIFVQTGDWPWQGWVLGLQIGLLSAVLIAVNNYRDLEEDRVVDKKTLVVRLGRKPVARLIYGMTLLPSLLVLFYEGQSTWFAMTLCLAFVFLFLEKKFLRGDGVSSKLLGLSALHLILFVISQNLSL